MRMFSAIVGHGVSLRTLLAFATVIAMVIAVVTPDAVAAMPDAWGP